MHPSRLSVLLFAAASVATAQSPAPVPTTTQALAAVQPVWQMQDSGSTASFRGIDSVDGKVAWASGTEGTVLRTTDGGAHWQKCAVPDGDKDGATLDFRGVQAWNADTAVVMASGPGDKSRLYKTADGCKTWKLTLRNPDKDGFWDAIYFDRGEYGWLLGDPVNGAFTLFYSPDSGEHWIRQVNGGLRATTSKQGAFAASNSSLVASGGFAVFGTGGGSVYETSEKIICVDDCPESEMNLDGRKDKWKIQQTSIANGSEASGVFSLGIHANGGSSSIARKAIVAVGGDYMKPNESAGTAAFSPDGGQHWQAPTTPPHGYRSTVAWDDQEKLWITAGTNGSDLSRDDGKTWQPLDNGNWNALSLPFVVGPKGRIARLNPAALPKP